MSDLSNSSIFAGSDPWAGVDLPGLWESVLRPHVGAGRERACAEYACAEYACARSAADASALIRDSGASPEARSDDSTSARLVRRGVGRRVSSLCRDTDHGNEV